MLSNPIVNTSSHHNHHCLHPMHISYRHERAHPLVTATATTNVIPSTDECHEPNLKSLPSPTSPSSTLGRKGTFPSTTSTTTTDTSGVAAAAAVAVVAKAVEAKKEMRRKKRFLTKKSVRWGSSYSYRSTHCMDDVSIMWYNQQDLEVFQREKRKIIRALKHVKGDMSILEGTKYVTRGFECYQSIAMNRQIRSQRQAVVQKVLQLQQEQKRDEEQRKQKDEQREGCGECPIVLDDDDDDEEISMMNNNNNNKMESDTLIHATTTTKTTTILDDPVEALAQVSRQESAWARTIALELGTKDAEMNEMVWQEFFATTDSNTMEEDDDDSSTCISASSSSHGEDSGSASPIISGDEEMVIVHPSS